MHSYQVHGLSSLDSWFVMKEKKIIIEDKFLKLRFEIETQIEIR